MIRSGKQTGYILLPVIVVITLVAAIALLMNTESALESNTAATELDAQQARYVAEAGMNHALWQMRQQGCGAYTNLTNVALGSDKYNTTLITDLGTTTSYSITVDQDSWIREDQPTDNKATDQKLHTKYKIGEIERALLRYDLSAIPTKATILSATAWFYVTDAHPEGPVDIHAITADWLETDATWDSMNDKMDKVVLTSIPAQPTQDVWVSVNLTSQVQAWVNGQPNYGITLNSTSAESHGQYNSRESANVPYLLVIVGTPPSSPAVLKAVGTLANGIIRSITRDDVTLYQNPPTLLQFQPDAVEAVDSYIWKANQTTNYGNDDETWVATGSSNEALALFKFDLADIPAGARVLGASLSVYQRDGNDINVPVSAYRITSDWKEDEVTWNKRNNTDDWDNPGGDYDPDGVSTILVGDEDNRFEWDVSSLVLGWVNGSYPNHGLVLRAEQSGTLGERFDTSDHADPTHHPRLNIIYSCACGEVCVEPQGSGNLLMVVINPTTLVAEDQQAKDLFESWGYTVSVISESANQSSYDAAVAVNDVVFISETVNSSSVGTKLVNAPIGVVSQDGDYNPDLGLAAGSTLKVGTDIDITSTDHYITRVFPVGLLPIYASSMEQLVTSGALTADQQSLAEIGGDASLVVVERGAAMEGGGSAAGRRVVLPLGTRYRFNWDYLNTNGRLMVQRALEWGIGPDKTSIGDLLLVVVNPSSLTTQETAKKILFESWGYAVNLIDESDNQTDFDAAVAVNDVVYITEDVTSGSVNTKLVNAAIGVVTEEDNLSDEFGMAASIAWESGTQVEINDNSHYITSPFSLGLLTFLTANESLAYVTGAQSPHLGKLASSTSGYGVVTLEAGDAMFGGGSAAGRRAQLPWGGDNFDVNHLNADGLTILRRALEWGTGAGATLSGHWKLDDAGGPTALDSSGRDNHGTLTGAPAWTSGYLLGALAVDDLTDDRVVVPDDPSLDITGAITLTAWIKPNDMASQFLISKSAFGVTDGYELSLSNAGKVFFRLNEQSQGTTYRVQSTSIYPTDGITWMHVAATYDGVTQRIYIDGVEEASKPGPAAINSNNIDVGLGGQPDGTRVLDGVIDDMRIYRGALDATEIAALAAQGPIGGPIAHWKLDDGTGLTAIDSEGGHDGTLTNGPAWVSGAIGDALDFDGGNDYVDVGTFDVSGSGITMMGWFNAEAIATDDGRIVSKANGPNEADAYWQLSTTDSGSNRFLRMRIKAGGTTTTFADNSINLVTDRWYLAVATYDAASGDMKLYLDGVEVRSGTHAVGGALDTNASVPVAIGANGTAERFFNGILDDVHVYDYALDAGAIGDYYAANSPPAAASFTEKYNAWVATSADTWYTFDLSAYGVPANAVVEVGVVNGNPSAQRWAGMRAVGSSLERRFQLHEPEAGGYDAVVMHVQANASSEIELYADTTGDILFGLYGYWTGPSYVELHAPFTANASNSWVTEDVSVVGLGPNQVAEIVIQNTSALSQWLAGVRATGAGYQRRFDIHEAEAGGVDVVTLMVNTDGASTLEAYAENNADIDFYVVGYWSTPPGTYTETGGVHGQVSTAATWEVNDVSGLGVPSNTVAQFVMSNESNTSENQMGVRSVGLTRTRFLDLQEAESGGADLFTLHANVDASSQVEWYAESGATDRFFYPVGWWVLSP